ncbi:MAG: hypothetical protein AB7V32_04730, partial [Candidatus Berkiella sp.]
MATLTIPGFREVPKTGVIYVMHRAAQMGYTEHDPLWVNLGQGAPQTNELNDSSDRISQLTHDPCQHEYSPVAGHMELRQK